MKFNLILFVILSCLLSGTYLWEEVYKKEKVTKEEEIKRVFNPKVWGKLWGLKTQNAAVFLKNQKWVTGVHGYAVDLQKLDSFFNLLGGLRVVRFLDVKDGSQFFQSQNLQLIVNYEEGIVKFALGDKIQYSQEFYMKITTPKKEFYCIVKDVSVNPEVYKRKDYHRSEYYYNKLSSAFLIDDEYFYDYRVMKKAPIRFEEVRTVSFTNVGNRRFSIDIHQGVTEPKVIDGARFSHERSNEFLRDLYKMNATKVIIDLEDQVLSDQAAILLVKGKRAADYELKLYRKLGEKSGYFLKSDFDDVIYQLSHDASRIFFYNVQDFWSKALKDLLEVDRPDGLTFQMGMVGEDGVTLVVNEKNRFMVHSLSGKHVIPIHNDFKRMFQFLTWEADLIRSYEENDDLLKRESAFWVTIYNQTLYFVFRPKEIIILNDTHRYKLVYWIGESHPIVTKFSDYFLRGQ